MVTIPENLLTQTITRYPYGRMIELPFTNNKYPPDNPVVFHRRADISPLFLAALLKGEMRTTACFCH